MIPAHFVLLEAFPLTTNGKIDQQKLEQIKIVDREKVSILPRTPIEEVLSGIWSSLFQVEQLSIEDNFFEQGGHSLLAAQLAYRIRDAFKVDITVGDVFEHPTIAQLAELISRTHVVEHHTQPLQPRSPQARIPLAFGQQRLWFLNQLAPDSPFYSTHAAIHLRGPLRIDILMRSLSEVLRRHEVLRTTFPQQDEHPVQMIAPPQPVMLPLIDLCELSDAQRANTLRSLLDSESRRSFDLARGPLVRGYLIQLDHQEHVVLMSVHHTIFDAWSRGIFLKEVEAFYTAFVADNKPANPPLPPLRVQYADFSLWQQSRLQHKGQESLEYWKQKLANIPMLELPTDRPRPAQQTFHGASAPFTLSPTLTAALNKLSRQEGASLFMTLMAAFQTLLYRYTGQHDISVSTGASNRTHADLEKLIGFFVNTLVLRCNLAGNPTFREVLRRVRQCALEAYAHQDIPFDLVIEQVKPERDLSYNPLFQVALILQNVPRPIPHMPEIELEFLKMNHASSKIDLTLNIQERSGGLTGSLEYNTDLFDPSTIERMLQHFRRLLECVIADPTQPIDSLSILTPEEWQQFLVTQNSSQTKEAPYPFFHRNFEAQVIRTPESIALQCGDQQISYLELNRRANMLARYLRAQGLYREGVVGIFSEYTIDTIIALIAVWKAGGTYLPLDPTYPREHLALLIANAGVYMVISPSSSSEEQSRDTGIQVIVLQDIWHQLIEYSDENLDVELVPDNLAYIIYTSGSTGQPKGVMLCHQGLSNVITAQIEGWGVQAYSRVLQFASLSFDASLSEIGMALLVGATLYVREDETWLIGTDLAQLLHVENITHVTLPPSILATLPEQPLPALATLIVAGEECPPLLAARWAAGRHLFNGYGPTEVTVGACYAEYTSEGGRLPICGKRFPHTQLFILDASLQPVPSGVIGELHIAGPGLARGYHNMPALTAERFIPHPFSQLPGARLYKTGDLARYRSDGNIEYMGRSDQQVKIRGFRIEPGEIEAVLTQCPAVRDAIVITHEDTREKKRLVAYIVLDQTQNMLLYEIQDFLKQRLPTYMLPAVLMPMTEFPLTSNGKINHKALPDPDSFRDGEERAFVAPRTEVEKALALIWSEVLHIEQVSIYDDFFEMGGDSLLSLEILARVKEVFGISISIQQVFKGTTVAEIARIIKELQS
jgi:amino acid adenylation domain-containing protein